MLVDDIFLPLQSLGISPLPTAGFGFSERPWTVPILKSVPSRYAFFVGVVAQGR